MITKTFVTPKAAAKHELLFNKPACSKVLFNRIRQQPVMLNNPVVGLLNITSDLSSTTKCDQNHISGSCISLATPESLTKAAQQIVTNEFGNT
jgi:hypothetical protein